MKIFTLIFLSIFLLCGCVQKSSVGMAPDKEIYMPQFSKGFRIDGFENSPNSLISVFNPWQGASDISSSLLILRDSVIPDYFSGQALYKMPERIVCMSSTHIAMLDALGLADKIVGVSGLQYVSNPYIRSNSNKIKDIGYEGNIDYETLFSLHPDIVLLYSVSGPSTIEPKLKEFGIPYMYIGDFLEEDPLGKTEWMIALAELNGKRIEAENKFEEIKQRYFKWKNLVAESNLPSPAVMLNMPVGDSWFMPSSESYVAKMIKDAGGNYIYHKNTGNSSLPIDIELAYKLVSEADLWLNPSTIYSLNDLKSYLPKFSDVECVKNENVFNNNYRTTPGGGNDCFESGVVNPDLILRDMIKIFHPSLVEDSLVYYHRLQ